jgi:hypothetical protein
MATEFTVTIPDVPGSLARLGQALGDGRVNIEAILATTRPGEGVVHFIADDVAAATRALGAGGFRSTTREVLVVRVLDTPGALGEVALVMAKAGVNIDTAYVTTRGHVVFGVDDLDGAIAVAGGLAVRVDE